MDWIAENTADADMLNLIDLSPLEGSHFQDNNDLAESVARHNQALTDLTARFGRLADERQVLADANHWFTHKAKAIVDERHRIVTESWDVLVALRELLNDRIGLLRKIEAHLNSKLYNLAEQLEEALYNARRSLEREHRQYLKSELARGLAYISHLAEEDEAVVALRQQETDVEHALQAFESLRYRNEHGTPILTRLREMYARLD